jgi:hypothetical protein
MPTKIGPLDHALIAFCQSLQAPVYDALRLDEVNAALPEGVTLKEGRVANLRVTIGAEAVKIAPVPHQGRWNDALADKDMTGFLGAEFDKLVDMVRGQMSKAVLPVSIEVEFRTAECVPRCTGLGVAGLHSGEGYISFRQHPLLSTAKDSLGGHVIGLDRLAEAMWFVEDLAAIDSDARLKVWDIREGSYLFEEKIYARSDLEAYVKYAVWGHGIDATLSCLQSENWKGIQALDFLSFMGSDLRDLDKDPLGRPQTLLDLAQDAAARLPQNTLRP